MRINMMLDHNHYVVVGPNGNPYVRSRTDRSICYSVAAFLAADWIAGSSKRALRLIASASKLRA